MAVLMAVKRASLLVDKKAAMERKLAAWKVYQKADQKVETLDAVM